MEVEIPSEKDFERVNQIAKDFVNKNLAAMIQKLTDELDPEVNYIIDQIEIDLGKINFQDQQSLTQTFGEQFRKQLSYKKDTAKVTKSLKFENAILEFVDQGSLPWWLYQSDVLKRNISKKKFSKVFLNKIRLLLMNSKASFFRLQSFLGTQGIDHFLKQLLTKHHPFYVSSLRLLDLLSEKTKHKWISSNYNKRVLQHLLIVALSDPKPDKKHTILKILKQFSEQTGQNIDDLYALSLTQIKDKKTELNQILTSISEDYDNRQAPQNLRSKDASSVLLSYLKNGFDELPAGYADIIVLDGFIDHQLVDT